MIIGTSIHYKNIELRSFKSKRFSIKNDNFNVTYSNHENISQFTEQTELIISQKLRSAIYKLKYFIHFFVFYIIWMKISEEKLFEIYQHSMISQWHGNDKYKHNLFPLFTQKNIPRKVVGKKNAAAASKIAPSHTYKIGWQMSPKRRKKKSTSKKQFPNVLFRLQLFCSFYTKISQFFWLA